MEPDVIRMYSSSPPPMEEGAEEDEDEFGDFSGVPNSISLTDFNMATTFNQSQTLAATSPPELLNGGLSGHGGSAKANGIVPGQGDGAPGRTVSADELKQLGERSQTTTHTDSVLIGERDWTEAERSQTTTHTDSVLIGERDWTEGDSEACNGNPEGTSRLTNGFAAFDERGTPPLEPHAPVKPRGPDPHAAATDCCLTSTGTDENEDDFADFAAFSNTNSHGHSNDVTNQKDSWGNPFVAEWQAEHDVPRAPSADGERGESSSEENVIRDPCGAEMDLQSLPSGTSGGLRNGDGSVHSWPEPEPGPDITLRDMETDTSHTTDTQCTQQRKITLNGAMQDGSDDEGVKVHSSVSPSVACTDDQLEEKPDSSGNDSEPETETETSFGRPLSTDALEEFGDFSTTCSVPSPPLQEETATPADHSQMPDDGDEEEFGDFGDFSSTPGGFGSGQEFTAFPQRPHVSGVASADAAHEDGREDSTLDTEEFISVSPGDPTEPEHTADQDQRSEDELGSIPVSDSFADFHSAPVGCDESGGTEDWTAFDEQHEEKDPGAGGGAGGESWASFGPPQTTALSEEPSEDDWQDSQQPITVPPSCSSDSGRTEEATAAALLCRVERLFQTSFPEAPMTPVEEEVIHLQSFLQPEGSEGAAVNKGVRVDVWSQLRDVHNAFGLKHQWGGSHSNKMLLCSLGIDTRNILFTGQKKQPVIVPMYAASLGMLEPTKEPVKPVSAAEMIASIAQTPAVATEITSTTTDTGQEVLPPVQFDWSSSGLTNPLDASGGSSLLNLDFFGTMEELVPSSGTSIPGVDPELYELTTAKLEQSGTGSRVADAFARLMSTVEKTSTSTRKPRKEENLSEEALKVITSLPDLSFMQAKVLMFPTSLTPLASSAIHTAD
ncbi:aftiphilin a isoform X3 [Clupea harengus]|uniref:Aftiphilin a isoform X3 n=1 Tax=Clupea harengus TaxID=7950 RepID=A0A6P8F6C2_CLUHA|nr:aftiphilin a isoform X3 [Clupea harengus]